MSIPNQIDLNVNNKKFRVAILPDNRSPNPGLWQGNSELLVGQAEAKPGAISQGASLDELRNNMADSLQLIEGIVGREPKGFWIRKTVSSKEHYNEDSWQHCVQVLEYAGYRLVSETDKHKKFRSPTRGGGPGAPNLGGMGAGGGGVGFSGPDLSRVSFVTVPLQTKIDSRIVDFYKKLAGNS